MNLATSTVRPPLILSRRDVLRLEALLASSSAAGTPVASQLEAELERAELREAGAIPADVVTMNSQVVCLEEGSGTERHLTLVYPHQVDGTPGQVSVLAPVGAALLGLSVGQSIDWPLPGGRTTRLRVLALTFQPEAAGLAE